MHSDLRKSNIVRFGKSLALIDFDSAYRLGDPQERMGSGSAKFCAGVLPPEMVECIDLLIDFSKLIQYETYWKNASDDAGDLLLLTPDDIQSISSAVHSLRAKAVVSTQASRTLLDELQYADASLEA